VFTARSRQNAFAKRRRAVAEAQAEESTEAPEPTAVPYDTRNAESADIVDAPDVSTFATGGVVPIPAAEQDEETVIESGEAVIPASVVVIDEERRAKIDAVLNHALTPVADELPDYAVEKTNGLEGHSLGLHQDSAPMLVEQIDTPEGPKRGRGRPRPQETIDRDNAVYRLLQAADAVEGVSKEALAIALDEKEQQVYSSLRQLTKEKRAETRYVKDHGYRWFAL